MSRQFIDGEEVVDLTPLIVKAIDAGIKRFMNAYNNGQRLFKMSFDHGVVYTVKIIGEAKESQQYDPKFDVEVVKVEITAYRGRPIIYEVGFQRWVRAYDLKPIQEGN